MLNKAKTLKGYALHSLDGEIGKVKEFYFDDQFWTIRYLVADTGNWLMGRQVLISPYALFGVDQVREYITVNLTKKQIEESPSLDADKPVSRQFEHSYYGHYGWPEYRSGSFMWGCSPDIVRDREMWRKATVREGVGDPNLRSTRDVNGRDIEAVDGDIGHVDDFLIDDETWAIRYLVVDTRNWWPGKKVLISPKWIERVSWFESKVCIGLSREAIKRSPEYREDDFLSRDYETGLHSHYNQEGYWVEESAAHERARSRAEDQVVKDRPPYIRKGYAEGMEKIV